MEDLLSIVNSGTSAKRKKHDNSLKFINEMEFIPANDYVPFYIIYWYYRKWCEMNNVKVARRVTKHVLSRAIGLSFAKKSMYPKYKKFGVTVDYQMVVFVDSPFFTYDKDEEELAFNYYHFLYDQERKSWKKRRRKKQDVQNKNTQG
ncbi:MAG: hypothetical protein RLZZ181_120 [Pseudomonadota bacterium]|jgi:hypothetical protein